MDRNIDSLLSTDALRSMALENGMESHVKVNQRMLIDKMLARYSSDFVVFRELIQNADDAQATSFSLDISCNQSNVCQNQDAHANDVRQTRSRFEYLLRLPWTKHKKHSKVDAHESEIDFHNSKINEIRASNDGHSFTKTDWQRIAAIADGNIDVNSVGQFGVGFFSVFAYSDQPVITSGKEYMVFVWKDDHSLTTYRRELPSEDRSHLTSIILQMRSPFVVDMNSNPDNHHETDSLFKTEKKNWHRRTVLPDHIVPTLDIEQLKIFFARVLSFTRYINELVISINGMNIFQVNKRKSIVPLRKKSIQFKQSSMNDIFQFGSFVHCEQTISIGNGPSLTLGHVTVEAEVTIDGNLHQMIQRTIKKRLPPKVSIQLLYAPNTLIEKLQRVHTSGHDDQMNIFNPILSSVIPLKFDNECITSTGLVFIGFATHQTTGIGMHIHSHLISTIERENLDLQDPYISIWNNELLTATGQIVRFIYDQMIPNTIQSMTNSCDIASIFASYSFNTTSPNQQIGMAILQGFFASNKDLPIPVRQSPRESHLSLIPSTKAFLTYSSHIYAFLALPLVPIELVQSGFFFTLKQNGLIKEVDQTIILNSLSNSILLSKELIALLTWLCTEQYNDKKYIIRVFSTVRFRENINSLTISLQQMNYYNTLNISPLLPLPPNVFPHAIAKQFSPEDLQFKFFLTVCTIKDLLEFYLSENQQKLFQDAQLSECLLRFISNYSSQIIDTYWMKIKTILSNIKCVATNEGMKLPSESYLPSSLLTNDLPMVTFKLSNTDSNVDDNCISVSFLKRIGCRIFNVQSLVKFQQNGTSIASSDDNMQVLILQLMEERPNMNEADFKSIKENKFLTGTTLNSKKGIYNYYAPHELHFPSVAIQLNWSSLPILAWFDINPLSSEYAFLKEIGVREVPDLNKLLDRIVRKHDDDQKQQTKNTYKIPIELQFFAQNFQQHYCNKANMDKLERAFIPSVWPTKTTESNIVLLSPSKTFTDISPICPVLLPEVIALFGKYFPIGLLGVREKPTLTEAFNVLMEKKIELLKTISSASIIFAYFNDLDGRNRTIIEHLMKTPFIPLNDNGFLVKPTQVFIRSRRDMTQSMSSPSSKTQLRNEVIDEIDTCGLIDFVDFGLKANTFLFGIGMTQYPSASVLAEILIERHTAYFKESMNEQQTTVKKRKAYLYCLKRLANSNNISNELFMGPIMERLLREPWCLGFQIVVRDDGKEEKVYQIATPREIYLDDDHLSAIDLKPLCSPDEPLLTRLYEKFGSRWLSDCVQRVFVHAGRTYSSDRAKHLQELILYRFDMLFVNNRGVRMEKIDEKKGELLSNTLSVYETDGIVCRLNFEGKTTMITSSLNSSCALELQNDRVMLYLLKGHDNIDYFEIARALAQFVFEKPSETIFYAINDKLASPLEVLKRRGIPVDRLLKHVELQQPEKMIQQLSSEKKSTMLERDRQKQNLKKDHQKHIPEQESQREQEKSDTHIRQVINSTEVVDSVKDFAPYLRDLSSNISRMIQGVRPFTKKELEQNECENIEDIRVCRRESGMHLKRCQYTFHSIPLYIDDKVTIDEKMMCQAKELAWLIKGLAIEVFKIPIEIVNLFRDIDTAAIAFNYQDAIFFNLRFYEQVFADELQRSTMPTIIIQKLVNFYFIITCHKLTHNVCPTHNISFINHMQLVAIEYMPAKDIFLCQLSPNFIEEQNISKF